MNSPSYCGINCEKCPVFIATITDSESMKSDVAEEWGRLYKRKFAFEEMTCYGCKSEIRFGLCSSCDIEKCNVSKGNENCRSCKEYPCNRISKFESNLKEEDLYFV